MEDNVNKKNVENPYRGKSGEALTKEDPLFFGREAEIKKILDTVIEGSSLHKGAVVIVYGHPRCGKTSLVTRVTGKINETTENTIVIQFPHTYQRLGKDDCLNDFNSKLFGAISSEICKQNIDDKLKEEINLLKNDISLDSSSKLNALSDLINKKHQLLLIMDEFTDLTDAIVQKQKEEGLDYSRILGVIKFMSEIGFVQIIIGHNTMMSNFEILGMINHTSDIATKVKVSVLEDRAARDLVFVPMKNAFGIDIFAGNKKNIDELLDCSGRSPFFLMMISEEIFDKYQNSTNTYITLSTLKEWMRDYAKDLEESDFYSLLYEYGESKGCLSADSPNFKYLLHVAKKMHSSEWCRNDDICSEFSAEENQKIKNTLVNRDILMEVAGKVKIRTKLFYLYLVNRFMEEI